MSESTATSPANAPYDLQAFPMDSAPEGDVDAIFIQGVWGKSQNLFSCFVTDDDTETAFRLSTFSRTNYAAYKGGPSLRYAQSGDRYRLTIGRSKDGRPTLQHAEKRDA